MLGRYRTDILDFDRRMRKMHDEGQMQPQVYRQFLREGFSYPTIRKHYKQMLADIDAAIEAQRNKDKLDAIAKELEEARP